MSTTAFGSSSPSFLSWELIFLPPMLKAKKMLIIQSRVCTCQQRRCPLPKRFRRRLKKNKAGILDSASYLLLPTFGVGLAHAGRGDLHPQKRNVQVSQHVAAAHPGQARLANSGRSVQDWVKFRVHTNDLHSLAKLMKAQEQVAAHGQK